MKKSERVLVYVVTKQEEEGSGEILGIFSSQELADNFASNLKRHGSKYSFWNVSKYYLDYPYDMWYGY